MDTWRTVDKEGLIGFLREASVIIGRKPVTFVCIGTDRSTGDALGPLVGTALEQAGYSRVIGTLASPCDANTLRSRLAELDALGGGVCIAVDAALGRRESVGKFQAAALPLAPGASLSAGLPAVGDYGIAGIVNMRGARAYAILQRTSLYRVMKMADEIAEAITLTIPK